MIRISNHLRRFLSLAIILVVGLSYGLQNSYGNQAGVVTLLNGKDLKGEVTVDPAARTLAIIDAEQSEIVVPYDEVEPSSLFRWMRTTVEDADVAGRLALVDFAVEKKLFGLALQELRGVGKLDEESAKAAVAERMPAIERMDQQAQLEQLRAELTGLQAAFDAARFKRAMRAADKLADAYPDSDAARDAGALKKELQALEQAEKDKAAANAQAGADAAVLAQAQAMWDAVKLRMEAGAEAMKAGITHDSNNQSVPAQQDFKRAIEEYDAALAELKKISDYCAKEPAAAGRFLSNSKDGYDVKKTAAQIDKRKINVHLNAAGNYLRDRLFKEAKNACNAVLQIDEDNEEAMQLKVEIIRSESSEQR